MPEYEISVGGSTYEVKSERELTPDELRAYAAKLGGPQGAAGAGGDLTGTMASPGPSGGLRDVAAGRLARLQEPAPVDPLDQAVGRVVSKNEEGMRILAEDAPLWAVENPAAVAATLATAPLGGIGGSISPALATAKWGPTLSRFILGAGVRTAAAGAAGAGASYLAGQDDPIGKGKTEALSQLAGEGAFGLGLPLAMKAFDSYGRPLAAKAGKLVAKSPGGRMARNDINAIVVERMDAAAKAAMDDFHKLENVGPKGETPAEVSMMGRDAVSNITGYGAPLGKARVAADGAFEKEYANIIDAARFAAERARMAERAVATKSGRLAGRAEDEAELLLRYASEADISKAAVEILRIEKSRPRMRAIPGMDGTNLGLGSEFDKMGEDWFQMVKAAEGLRVVPPSVLMKNIGNIHQRLLSTEPTREARNAMEKILPMLEDSLKTALNRTPEGQVALDTWKSSKDFYAGKQEFYKRAAFKIAREKPENLIEMLRPRDPQSVDTLATLAKEANLPTLTKDVSRQLLDKVVGESSFGLAERMAPWASAPGQGMPSTAARLAQVDPEFGAAWNRLRRIGERLKTIETMPTARGDRIRELLVSLGTGYTAKRGLTAFAPPATMVGSAAAGYAMAGAPAAIAMALLPQVKTGLEYVLVRAAENPQAFKRVMDGLDALQRGVDPAAATNFVRIVNTLQPKEKEKK